MDKLHKEHEFVTAMWKFMKTCEEHNPHDEAFWEWAQESAGELERIYRNLSFVPDWIASYLKFLDCTEAKP